MQYTDGDGNLTAQSNFYNDQLWQCINEIVTYFNQGITFPSFTTAEILALEPDAQNGTVWFNTTLAKLQVKTASSTIETITSV